MELDGKHKLAYEWTFWFDKNSAPCNFELNLAKIGSFDTIEGFWEHYNHLLPPSQLSNSCSYHLFRSGIKPMWEDSANKNGGKWFCSFPKQHQDRQQIDNIWELVVISLIGGQLEESEGEICGVVISRRKVDKLSVWVTHKNDYTRNKLTPLIKTTCIYESHEETARKTRNP